jgi:hypothetical protein
LLYCPGENDEQVCDAYIQKWNKNALYSPNFS